MFKKGYLVNSVSWEELSPQEKVSTILNVRDSRLVEKVIDHTELDLFEDGYLDSIESFGEQKVSKRKLSTKTPRAKKPPSIKKLEDDKKATKKLTETLSKMSAKERQLVIALLEKNGKI